MKIGTVVEGPTDRLLLKAIINKLYPGEHDYRDLQPLDTGDSFGSRGAGWKGVRRFCYDVWQHYDTDVVSLMADYYLDLLVIHVDADIALETDLQEDMPNPLQDVSQPCPPTITPTAANLQQVIIKWLNLDNVNQLSPNVIIVIPAQDSENWIFAGLFTNDPLCQQANYECLHPENSHQHPAYLLILQDYGKVLQRKDGKIKKPRKKYQKIVPKVVDNWNKVCEICSQAQMFNDRLHQIN